MVVNRYEKPIIGGVSFRSGEDNSLDDMSITHLCTGKYGVAFKKIVLNHK